MTLIDTLTSEIDNLLRIEWKKSEGDTIPGAEDAALNESAKIEATFLYADLAGSSMLAQKCPLETTAKIIRVYLATAVRLIKEHGGEIGNINGDRVMGIFKGEIPNTTAVNCARKIDWMVEKIINPKVEATFPSIRNNKITIKHCIGIDTSEAWVVRSGIGNNNNLIWIGKAPGFAAKLSKIRKYPYSVYISRDCFIRLGDIAKEAGEANIWFEKTFKFGDETHTVYRTNGMLRP